MNCFTCIFQSLWLLFSNIYFKEHLQMTTSDLTSNLFQNSFPQNVWHIYKNSCQPALYLHFWCCASTFFWGFCPDFLQRFDKMKFSCFLSDWCSQMLNNLVCLLHRTIELLHKSNSTTEVANILLRLNIFCWLIWNILLT